MSHLFSDAQDTDLTETHDINVTPFIDVMLVLLIIFMVAAPLATASIPVDLPSNSAQQAADPEDPVFLTVSDTLQLTINDNSSVSLSQLTEQLAVDIPEKDTRIFLRADKQLSYDELMQVVNTLGQAGYVKIALVGLEQVSVL